jgi:hypothetical protein
MMGIYTMGIRWGYFSTPIKILSISNTKNLKTMTQQIKFRGFRTDGKGWVEGSLVDFGQFIAIWNKDGDFYEYIQKDRRISPEYIVDPESLGMFTGQTDKNGREIFGAIGEKGGDRCKRGRHKELYDIVMYQGAWSIKTETNNAVWHQSFCNGARSSDLEIIGNQFENNGR